MLTSLQFQRCESRLGQYFEESEQQAEILEFVTAQLGSTSPKTRKIAEGFLRKRNHTAKRLT